MGEHPDRRYGLDYVPLRLVVMSRWVAWTKTTFPGATGWQPFVRVQPAADDVERLHGTARRGLRLFADEALGAEEFGPVANPLLSLWERQGEGE
jgi:hypothetical protein